MRILSIALLLLFGTTPAFAQVEGRPFLLADGSYKFECWSAQVRRLPTGESNRTQGYQKGTNDVSTFDGVTTESFLFQDETASQEMRMIRKTTTKALGNGLFLQIFENQTGEKTSTFEVQIKVDGVRNLFVTSLWNGQPQDVTGREAMWRKMIDGRIVIQDYILGASTPTSLHTQTTCVFTPLP